MQGELPLVEQWLANRSLQATRMRSGLLISGDRTAFEKAFEIQLSGTRRPAKLPISTELRKAVSSIIIPQLPDYGMPYRE